MSELVEIRKVLQMTKKRTQKGPILGNRSDFSTTKKMQNPPNIMPNYGKRKCMPGVPKTKVSRVLLYDNVTQQHMLDVKRANIKIEKERTERLFDLQIRSFTARMSMRHDRRLSKSTVAPNLIEKQGTKRIAPHSCMNRSNSSVQEKSCHMPAYPSMHRLDSFPMNQSELERFSSTSSGETARFPKLEKAGTEIMLSLQTRSGHRKLYYSSDERGLFLNLFPLYKFYPGVTKDPRFTKLESLLASSKLTA